MLISAILKLRKWILHATSRYSQVLLKLDRLITAHWWWRLKRKLAEHKLEKVLEANGEYSISARRALVQLRKIDFAFVYGRPASAEVRAVVKALRKTGQVPLSALWTLVINRDIQSTPDGVRVRRAWWAGPLKYAAQGVTLIHMAYLGTYTLFLPGAAGIKALTVVGIILIYSTLYMVWHLYTARPLAVIKRYGDIIDLMAKRIQSNSAITCRSPRPSA